MAVSDIIPYGQRPELHTLNLPVMGRESRTQGRAQRLKIIRKIPLRGYGQVPRIVAWSWPVTQGLPLALNELNEGTVSTDPW